MIKKWEITVTYISGKTNPAKILKKQLPIASMTMIKEVNWNAEFDRRISIYRGEC
jgi:hypothetical protein